MLYILFGQDNYSLRLSLEKIKRGIGDQALLAANITTIDGQEVALGQLRAACEAMPFLAEKRLVIINGLLERFEPRGRPGRQKRAMRKSNQRSDYKSFGDYINNIGNIPDSTILVLVDGKVVSNNPLLRELSAKAEVRSFPSLRGAKLRQWIQGHVTKEGGIISPGAIDLLVGYVGGDLWIMASEIEKLLIFTSGRRIEEEDVKAVVSYAQQASVFAMVDAILELKVGTAERLLQQLLASGTAPAYLLVLLSRQVRLIVRATELRNQGRPEAEIQSRLGLASEFVLRKTLGQANRYSLEQLKQVYRKLLEADLDIKLGRYGGELTLNILIAKLCQGRER